MKTSYVKVFMSQLVIVFFFIAAFFPIGLHAQVQNDTLFLQTQVGVLQQTVDILSKTNEALNQRWTPLNTIFAALAALFTLVTLLWAGIFAFGFSAYKTIEAYKKEIVKDAQKLRIDAQETMKEINSEAEEVLGKVKDKKTSLVELEKELKQFKEKSEKAIERLEDKSLVTVSGVGRSTIGGYSVFDTPSFTTYQGFKVNTEAQICSKCGNLFIRQNNPLINDYEPTYRLFSKKILCERCQKEKRDPYDAAVV